LIFVRAGTFDDPNLANPAMTIWTSSAPRWACIDAALPRAEKQAGHHLFKPDRCEAWFEPAAT
jgi:hypothetical protein